MPRQSTLPARKLPNQLLTKRETAELLAVSQRTIERLVHRGQLRVTRVGALLRFAVDDVERYLKRDPAPVPVAS